MVEFGHQVTTGRSARIVASRSSLGGLMGESGKGKLLFMCGKMAAGKSTLARSLAATERGVLLVQDDLLESLYPGEFVDVAAFLKYSARLRATLAPHIVSLLSFGMTVVIDFPANTRSARLVSRNA